jgi:hypothetical protein
MMRSSFLAVVVLGLLVGAPAASADVLGSFDVYLEVPGWMVSPPELAGYNVEVEISPADGGVALNSADPTDASPHPPIFGTSSPTVYGGDGNFIQVGDDVPSGAVPITDGAGLCKIHFAVDPAVSSQTFTVTVDEEFNLLADGDANAIEYVAHAGEIQIDGEGLVSSTTDLRLTIVPEPATLALLGLGGLAMALRKRRTA